MSKQEIEQLDYDDALVSLYSVCQQYGVRDVLDSFRSCFPDMFEEIVAQINRLPQKQVAALLMKKVG